MLLFKVSLSALIPDINSNTSDGIKWGKRIAEEKIYNKISDVNLERNRKELNFEPYPDGNIVNLDELLSINS